MGTIRFEPAGITCLASSGANVLDITDETPATNVPYSCRSSSCGTCRVFVRPEDRDAFEPAEDDEQEVLDVFGDGPDVRLACQLRLRKDADVVLTVVEPV
ncbi:MAG: 2Fe-2S iron-sulfur cluster-binding protein [Myxococcota bacterium]